MLLAGDNFRGAPQNQSGGVNATFQPDGTNQITTGANFTPTNWMSIAPQPGIGVLYFITFTDTGLSSGTALIISNNNVQFPMTSPQYPSPSAGIGGRNFSYVIKSGPAGGGPTVASGTGTTRNDI